MIRRSSGEPCSRATALETARAVDACVATSCPAAGWLAGERYTLRLGPALADDAGNAWGKTLAIRFDVEGSEVLGTYPTLATIRDIARLGNWLFVAAEEKGLAVMLITHDMGVIAEMADEVVVMYLGREVERGPVDQIFHAPKHPYTRSLLRSIPSVTATPRSRLKTITGSIPHPYARPKGCPFHPRCPDWIKGTCETAFPATTSAGPRQEVSCFLYTGAVAERAA